MTQKLHGFVTSRQPEIVVLGVFIMVPFRVIWWLYLGYIGFVNIGLYGDYRVWGYSGIMEKKMETTF